MISLASQLDLGERADQRRLSRMHSPCDTLGLVSHGDWRSYSTIVD